MKLTVQDLNKKTIDDLDVNIFDTPIRYDIIQRVLIWYNAEQRQPIANTKLVSEIRGSTRKIYKQKGTGNARHGSNRRAQFRGGNKSFGPRKERNFSTKINKKVKKLGLYYAVAHALKNNIVTVMSNLSLNSHKTRDYVCLFPNVGHKKTLFIDSQIDRNLLLASRNVINVNLVQDTMINTRNIMQAEKIFISTKAMHYLINKLT